MTFPSHYVEVVKHCEKNLILDYQIEKMTISLFGRIINMNNWLTFKDWLEIYEKVESTLKGENSRDDISLNCFDRNDFLINNNSIKIEIVKEKFEISYSDIFRAKSKHFHNFILRIYIKVAKKSNENIPLKENTKFKKLKRDDDCTLKINKSFDVIPEPYKPSNTKSEEISSSILYKPSTISQEEPYTPKPITQEEIVSPELFSSQSENPDTYPVYKPTPISLSGSEINKGAIPKNSFEENIRQISKRRADIENEGRKEDQRETRSKRRLDICPSENDRPKSANAFDFTKNKIVIKKSSNKELFGSDDSETEQKCDETKNLENKKLNFKNSNIKTKQKLSSSKSSHHEQRKQYKDKVSSGSAKVMDKWINNDSKLNKEPVSIIRTSNNIVIKQEPISTLENEYKIRKEKNDIEALNKLNKVVEGALKPSNFVEMKTLNHLSSSYILSTFKKYKSVLDEHFKTFKSSKQNKAPKIEDLDYMAIQNYVPEKHLLKMCTFLREQYESLDGVPEYTDLYMNLLVPEWVLAIFMEEYHMNRKEALQQILEQEESNTMSTQMFENSLFDSPS